MNQKSEDKIAIFNVAKGAYETVDKIHKTDREWRKILTREQFEVTRKRGTERAFTCAFLNKRKRGVFKCVGCGTDLFSADNKFESGTGWPSYWQPVAKENVGLEEDSSFFMRRTEVHCARCGAHLGHVFDDGPPPTHKRYCINSVALKFVEEKNPSSK